MEDIQDLIAALPTQDKGSEGSGATQSGWTREQLENWVQQRRLQNESRHLENKATEGISKTKPEPKRKSKVLTKTAGKVKTEKEVKTGPTKKEIELTIEAGPTQQPVD